MSPYFNVKDFIEAAINSFKAWENHLIFAVAFMIDYLASSPFYNMQNFDLPIYMQHCIVLLSVISILAGLIRSDGKLAKLVVIAALTLMVSLVAVLSIKVANSFINYLSWISFVTVFMFLQQIKYILFFACQSCHEKVSNHGD